MSLFFNKVAGQACNLFKKETLAQVFLVNFAEFLRTPFFTEHLRTTAFEGSVFKDLSVSESFPARNYLLKDNNKNT